MSDDSQAAVSGRKGKPWTDEEHSAFLEGLQQLGKGNWRAISRQFVPSKTPTQVASHAQKHFLRLQKKSNTTRGWRRKSRFDADYQDSKPSSPTVQSASQKQVPLAIPSIDIPIVGGSLHNITAPLYLPPAVMLAYPSTEHFVQPQVLFPQVTYAPQCYTTATCLPSVLRVADAATSSANVPNIWYCPTQGVTAMTQLNFPVVQLQLDNSRGL